MPGSLAPPSWRDRRDRERRRVNSVRLSTSERGGISVNAGVGRCWRHRGGRYPVDAQCRSQHPCPNSSTPAAFLEDRITALGRSGSWPEIIADLDSLTETEIAYDGKRFIVRSAPRPAASLALRAAGVANRSQSRREPVSVRRDKICRETVCTSQRPGGVFHPRPARHRRRDRNRGRSPCESRGMQGVSTQAAGNQICVGLRGGAGRTRNLCQAIMRDTRTSVEREGRIGWVMVLAGRPGCGGCASGGNHLLIGPP
jgi:hypothetical protein